MEKFNLLLPKGGKGGSKPAFLRKVYHNSNLVRQSDFGRQLAEITRQNKTSPSKSAKIK